MSSKLIVDLIDERDKLLITLTIYKKFVELIASGGSDKASLNREEMMAKAVELLSKE